jgi:hypothetical protein
MIPSEPDFVKVALQMLWAEIMKNTLLDTLQNGVERFCRVVVDLTPGKFFLAVFDPFVSAVRLSDPFIRLQLIR